MITAESDNVFHEFRKRLETALTDVDYTGPMSAEELDLPNDLVTSLIEVVFGVLENCLGTNIGPAELAIRVHNVNVIQQMHINNRIRKSIFKGDRKKYLAAGGGKLSDGLIDAMRKGTEAETVGLIEYVRNGTAGLTHYPDL